MTVGHRFLDTIHLVQTSAALLIGADPRAIKHEVSRTTKGLALFWFPATLKGGFTRSNTRERINPL